MVKASKSVIHAKLRYFKVGKGIITPIFNSDEKIISFEKLSVIGSQEKVSRQNVKLSFLNLGESKWIVA